MVFLDLVAQLLLKNCFEADSRKVPDEMRNYYDDGFELHLYVAFLDRASAIGLQLIEALADVNRKLGLSNFKLTLRLAKPEAAEDGGETPQKMPRWTPAYIAEQLTPPPLWPCNLA